MASEKLMTAHEAVQKYIKPGTQVCPCGFSYTRRPFTLIREIIRQGIGDLYVTMNGGTACTEALAGCGLVKRIESTYLGLEGIQPVANSVRRGIEEGEIELVEDYSNYGYATRTVAGKYGWPFAPLVSELGSDILTYDTLGKAGLRGKNPDGSWIDPRIPPKKYHVVDDPFDGWGLRPHDFEDGDKTANQTNDLEGARTSTKYTGNPGIQDRPGAAGDAGSGPLAGATRRRGGNGPPGGHFRAGHRAVDRWQAADRRMRAGRAGGGAARRRRERNHIPAHITDAIVEQPFGGYPSAVPNYYDYDWDWFVSYGRTNRRPKEEVRAWWADHVQRTEDDWEYLSSVVGMKRLFELRAQTAYGYRPDLARQM